MPDTVVVADMEAGLEHLSWAGGTLRHIDILLVVADSQLKSLLTAKRTYGLARQLGIRRVALVGNRIAPGEDAPLRHLAAQLGVELLALIPEDAAVKAADRLGRCLLDSAPQAAATRAIETLVDDVVACAATSAPSVRAVAARNGRRS